MKKTIIFLASSVLLLAACGGKPAPTDSSEAEKPTTSQAGDHKHQYGDWTVTKEPTCTEKGQKERTCSCGDKQTQDVAATGHSYIDVAGGTAATCTTDGVSVQECGVCHDRKETPIPAKGHTWVNDGEKTNGFQKQKCECGGEAYVLSYADSERVALPGASSSNTGATEKLKNATATWDLALLPRAKYAIWGNVKSTAADHGDRKWYNMATCDPVEETRESNADTAAMPQYRYHFDEEGAIINPTNKKSREEDGITNTDFTWCQIVDKADVGGEKFSLVHDGMGYSMIFDSIRLEKVGAAEVGYEVTFNCDEHCRVEIFKSQDYSRTPVAGTKAVSRNSETGQVDGSGEGQVNFKLIIDEGYTLDSMKGTVDCYKSIKQADGDYSEGVYKITKVCDDMTCTIKTKADTGVEEGFVATFVHPAEYPVTVFPTQDITKDGVVTDTAFARTKAGLATLDTTAEPQLNFVIGGTLPAGKKFNVTATAGTYNKIKADPEGDGTTNFYRITKVNANITVTIEVVDA